MHFDAASRFINRCVTGRREMICTTAFVEQMWLRHLLDLVLYFHDGPDHCMRKAAEEDTRGWGWIDPVEHVRKAGL